MKHILLILSFALASLSLQAHAFLSPEQSQQVLTALNDACGDNWCEGVYDIQFERIRCSTRNHNCLLSMSVSDSYDEKAVPKKYSCLLDQISSVNDIFVPSLTGLSVEFTSTVSKCLGSFQP